MHPHQYSYSAARAAFLQRADGHVVNNHIHPLPGPDGEVAMDIACWRNDNTDRVLVISSGTHGIEGYCGSFIQCALLDEGLIQQLARSTNLLLIHAINPHGFAWRRRVNEDNIDLNRNFIDHSAPRPVNEGYRELAGIMEPTTWDEHTDKQINAALAKAAQRHPDDPRWLQAAMSGGQYEFPNGLFYGGVAPSWSYRTMMEVADAYLRDKDVIWVDIHTALGAYGTGQCIVDLPANSQQMVRASNMWADRVANIGAADSVSVNVSGTVVEGVARELNQSILWTGLEFGTVPPGEVGLALLQDQWLHRYSDPLADRAEAVKKRMMDAFYPDDDEWRRAVLDIARDVVAATQR